MISFLLLAIPTFFAVRHFERAGEFDSIGLWYTIYVTAALSGAGAAVVVVIIALAQWIARTEGGATGSPNKSLERRREG